MSKSRILIVEDDALLGTSLQKALKDKGYTAKLAQTSKESERILKRGECEVALLDMRLPDANGLDLLSTWREQWPDMVTVMCTAYADVESAVACIKAGAFDFLTKPVDHVELITTLENALKHRELSNQVTVLSELTARKGNIPGAGQVVGSSDSIKNAMKMAETVARSEFSCLLITGESGTGKGLFAHAIHKMGQRADKPMVEVNCSALPETLIESELFGHRRGSFTDAKEDKMGLFQMADGGTLFLDEIGDMDIGLQAKLLKVMEENTFRRIGDTQDIVVDISIIAATNQDLEQLVEEDRFRSDLWYRLNVIPLKLEPLRTHKEDIMELADFFVGHFARKFSKKFSGFTKAAEKALKAYDWPGNARELRNIVERGCILAPGKKIGVEHLMVPGAETAAADDDDDELRLPAIPLASAEKKVIEAAMRQADGNKNEAARILDIHRSTLYKRLEQYEIDM